jgi:hypothetical protein
MILELLAIQQLIEKAIARKLPGVESRFPIGGLSIIRSSAKQNPKHKLDIIGNVVCKPTMIRL